MRKLVLIKHAPPEVAPGVPPEQWVLSGRGRDLCAPLADAVRPHAPAVVVSSRERKAAETGEVVAARLGVPFEVGDDLHEHDRSGVPHLPSREFISLMEAALRRPDDLVLGRETAAAAGDRFARAVGTALARHPDGNIAVVSHGTVIALFLAACGAGRAFDLWRRLGLPSFAVLSVPSLAVEAVIDRVG